MQVLQTALAVETQIQQQVSAAYREAVRCYVKYLKLTAGSQPHSTSATDTNITVMLRLLRLLVKYGHKFADLFDEELTGCSAMAWCHIVPQLFARLGHPDAYVREQVTLRLQRVGIVATHEVVYPAIVGVDTSTGSVALAYSEIESHLQQHSPELVSQVRQMLNSLNKLTSTSIEVWHSVLQKLVAEIDQRLTNVTISSSFILSVCQSICFSIELSVSHSLSDSLSALTHSLSLSLSLVVMM